MKHCKKMILVDAEATPNSTTTGVPDNKTFEIPTKIHQSIHDNVDGEKSKFARMTNKVLKLANVDDEVKIDHYSSLLRQYLQNKENEKNQKKRDLNEIMDQINAYISRGESDDEQNWGDDPPVQKRSHVSFPITAEDNATATAQGLINKLKNIEKRYNTATPSTSRQDRNSDVDYEEVMDESFRNLSVSKTPQRHRGLKRRMRHKLVSKAKRPLLKTPRGREIIKVWETRSRKKQTKP